MKQTHDKNKLLKKRNTGGLARRQVFLAGIFWQVLYLAGI